MSARLYPINAQQEIFLDFWNRFSQQVANSEGTVDFPRDTDLKPHHITTIIRLPKDIAEELVEQIKTISPNDYHYPTSDMHLTLINLDKLLADQEHINWQYLSTLMTEEINNLPSLNFIVRGINIFPTTIFAEIYDKNGVLEAYREAILRAVRTYLSLDFDLSNYTALVPGVTFTNLIRFKNKPSPAIIDEIKNKRAMEFGAFKPDKFEIVKTNKLLSIDGTIIKSVIPTSKVEF